jgi:hypothetical protein
MRHGRGQFTSPEEREVLTPLIAELNLREDAPERGQRGERLVFSSTGKRIERLQLKNGSKI